jgi:hypothetical protein
MDPNPDPLDTGMDPRIRIRTIMSWIRNPASVMYLYLSSERKHDMAFGTISSDLVSKFFISIYFLDSKCSVTRHIYHESTRIKLLIILI